MTIIFGLWLMVVGGWLLAWGMGEGHYGKHGHAKNSMALLINMGVMACWVTGSTLIGMALGLAG